MAGHKSYEYDPSEPAAIAYGVLFLLGTAVLLFHMIRWRIWFFIPFAIGGLLEVIGYIARAISASQTPNWEQAPFITQTLCLLLPPAFFAASMYMSLGRLIRAVHREDLSIIRVNWLTKLFVGGDVLSFLLQALGGGILTANNGENYDLGSNIILVSLILQLLYFGLFIVSGGIFHWRVSKTNMPAETLSAVSWRKTIGILYATSSLVLIRSIYRTVEYAGGKDSALNEHEAYFYVFDGTLMFLVVALYAIVPPKDLSVQLRSGGNYKTAEGEFVPLDTGMGRHSPGMQV